MCAIFGSSDFNTFCKLYELNKPRGISASSATVITKDGWIQCKKSAGAFDEHSLKPGKMYLGHCQAPTTNQQEFNQETAHPFTWNRFYVAHNGIITNAEDLDKEFNLELFKQTKVDSSVIPEIIVRYYHGKTLLQLPEVMKAAAEKLKGTFACYILSDRDNRVFLMRSGSTLFYDRHGNFSSTRFESSVPFEEGRIAEVTNNSIVFLNSFNCNSPFFI